MNNFCVIDTNDFKSEDKINLEQFTDLTKNIIKFYDYADNISQIIDKIANFTFVNYEQIQNDSIDSLIISENDNYVIYCIYLSEINDTLKLENNHLTKFIVKQLDFNFVGKAAFIKVITNFNGDAKNTQINIEDIYNLYIQTIYFNGLFIENNKISNIELNIKSNDIFDKLIYDNLKIEHKKDLSIKNNILAKYDILIFYNNTNKGTINKIATKITNTPIYGVAIFINRVTSKSYNNLDKDIFIKLYQLCEIPLEYHKLTNINNANNKQNLITKYVCLNNLHNFYLENYKNKCFTCKVANLKLFYCSKCYRYKYCSIECQKKDYKNHKKICNYK